MPKFYAQIDASGVPIAGFVLETLASAPTSPTNGRSYYDTALNKARTYQNGQWINFADGQVQSVNGHTGIVVLTKSDVGLANVDNTSDANKPISSATQTALNAKAPLSSPAFTGSPTAPTPTAATGIANKSYVDMAIQGLSAKASVRVATTGNITLSGTQTIDSVAVAVGDRVLVKNQTTQSANGIYIVQTGSWTRATDFDSSAEIQSGAYAFVEEGTVNHDNGWVLTTDGTITIGTTDLNFTQFSGAGSIIAGDGLYRNGNTLAVFVDGVSITVGSGLLAVATGGVDDYQLADGAVDLNGTKATGVLPILKGGTGATNSPTARQNLDIGHAFRFLVTEDLPAGTWVTPSGITNWIGVNNRITCSFMVMGGGATNGLGAYGDQIVLDWRINGTINKLEVKSDIAIPGSSIEMYCIQLEK